MSRVMNFLLITCAVLTTTLSPSYGSVSGSPLECEYWVAPAPVGSDQNPGSFARPWATMEHASEAARDDSCTIWFKDGIYRGFNELERRFETPTTFRAVNDIRAVLEADGPAIEMDGIKNMHFSGFEIRHSGPGADKTLLIMDRRDDIYWSEYISFTNNIIHDSYNNDLFKIHNGVRHLTIRGNIFYNQGDSEEHIDANGITDIIIEDNIFFNDFAGSGRVNSGTTKFYITIKDSNGAEDDQVGSERIMVRRNIFLNWEGGTEAFVNAGNDGKPYYEAKDVTFENNLFIGNSQQLIDTAFSVRGSMNITFTHNTVVGDLPARAYALRSSLTDENLKNRNLLLANNIWSDPTGTMGAGRERDPDDNRFATGDPEDTINLVLHRNLYWNGPRPIPERGLVAPLVADANPVVANPQLPAGPQSLVLPRWNGSAFASGNTTVRQEFERLVDAFGRIPPLSPAAGQADPNYSPSVDILGRPRGASPDLGAFQTDAAAVDLTPRIYLPMLLQ